VPVARERAAARMVVVNCILDDEEGVIWMLDRWFMECRWLVGTSKFSWKIGWKVDWMMVMEREGIFCHERLEGRRFI